MIYIKEKPAFRHEPVHKVLANASTLKEKMDLLFGVAASFPINGCITGSYWLPDFEPDVWGSIPDLDIFVYSEEDLVKGCAIAEHVLLMTPGTGSERSEKQERLKLKWLAESGINYKSSVTTYKFFCDGVVLNITYKTSREYGRRLPLTNVASVLASFDMSIVLQGYDIKTAVFYDLRPAGIDPKTAVINPMRRFDYMTWDVDHWTRQFDRCVKYWTRGFDTRPVAREYVRAIDECLEAGCVFDTQASHENFDSYAERFRERRDVITAWLESVEEEGE